MANDELRDFRDTVDRRFPEALAEELRRALGHAERLIPDPDERWEMLSRFRRNRTRYIAAWGLEPNDRAVDGLEPIPFEYHDVLHDLDRAYAKLQDYRLHPEHYVSATVAGVVESALQSRRARGPRDETTGLHEKVARYLKHRNIEVVDRGLRKGIVQDAMKKFGLSERTVRRIMSDYGLSGKTKK
ncbi:hypothetical protein [Ralstonia mannitolilytica]|uniref:hypothetical protein n=1 Tax=Ralstonia mannitolilytica TaxID=105219 RepID=UPI00292DCE8B|nr:hypothetical protein [Ralstonia mannitolilytica]